MKKTISIVLTLLLALSCLSAGFAALASSVQDLSRQIIDFDLDALKQTGGLAALSV